ncbi:hypothetical protein [Pseudonocardia aurantiaca]|uniref:hypothetical protein n=1 Tax=Pseudonocardia aurantiaca TaxID=75290 RepID=UPI0036D327F0
MQGVRGQRGHHVVQHRGGERRREQPGSQPLERDGRGHPVVHSALAAERAANLGDAVAKWLRIRPEVAQRAPRGVGHLCRVGADREERPEPCHVGQHGAHVHPTSLPGPLSATIPVLALGASHDHF